MSKKKELKLMFLTASRPNFMKISPLIKEAKKQKIKYSIFYIGQHQSEEMTGVFAKEFGFPKPNFFLNLQKQARKNSKVRKVIGLIQLIPKTIRIIKSSNPTIIVVVGDVASSAYIAILSKFLRIHVAHVEAGMRSFDIKMPEEKARRIIDNVSKFLFTTEKIANQNLLEEGKREKDIFLVGNIMIDNLIENLKISKKSKILKKLKLKKKNYVLLTMHRVETINDKENLRELLEILYDLGKEIKIVMPIHPRTKEKIKRYKLENLTKNFMILPPQGYLNILKLQENAKFVLTDSGGIQSETTFLKVPCLTLRKETEHICTIEEGSNTLVGRDPKKIKENVQKILQNKYKKNKIPKYWDGKTSERIIKILKNS
ncbi:MAG: UDP-N-acetylglucosamine 2-epimerase (non-hydrolyzing) [archaeon]